MIPHEPAPETQPIEATPAPQLPISVQPPPPVNEPFWDYSDFFLFIAFAIPFLFLAAFVVQAFSVTGSLGKPLQGLLAQLLWYALVFGGLYVMLRIRYGQPFWRSLGWKFPFRGMPLILFGGPVLAIAIGYIGYLIQTPDIETPFRQMLSNRPTFALFAIFVVFLGPLFEELAFRGFLMPLLVRSLGVAIGIVVTGALFGCLHAPEYGWSWRHVLLISTAGSVFGWVRHKTGSTAASTTMHAAYNLTQFAAFMGQSQ
jgi:membrane protease YdiL (CAAX protease family)